MFIALDMWPSISGSMVDDPTGEANKVTPCLGLRTDAQVRVGVEAGIGMLKGDKTFPIYSKGIDLYKVGLSSLWYQGHNTDPVPEQTCYSDGKVVESGPLSKRDLGRRDNEQDLVCPVINPLGLVDTIFDALA